MAFSRAVNQIEAVEDVEEVEEIIVTVKIIRKFIVMDEESMDTCATDPVSHPITSQWRSGAVPHKRCKIKEGSPCDVTTDSANAEPVLDRVPQQSATIKAPAPVNHKGSAITDDASFNAHSSMLLWLKDFRRRISKDTTMTIIASWRLAHRFHCENKTRCPSLATWYKNFKHLPHVERMGTARNTPWVILKN